MPLAKVTVPQTHLLGAEAEVDFGTISVYLAGVLCEVSLFVMRLSASGRGFCRAYLNEAQEVFLDGHVRAFAHFGGVPGRVRYDNLKAAVVKVLKGRATGTSRNGSLRCDRTTASTASFACPASTGRTRRPASRARSAGSVAGIWSRSRVWGRWPN